MKIRTVTHEDHVALQVPEVPGVDRLFCGDSWCTGTCGLPALTLKGLKAHSNSVAVGPVWQEFRVSWAGEKVEVSDFTTETPDDLQKMLWL